MSKLDELIAELCPEGVVYKAIDELAKTLSPQVKIKSHDYLDCGQYPVIDQGQDFIGGYTNDNRVFPKGEYIIFGDHTCVVKYIDFEFAQGADGVKVLIPKGQICCKYLYYCMCSIKMDTSYARHWSKMRAEKIPLPPLAVQQEIVRILDSFTKLTAELTAELTARRKQYEYYRDQLLTFGDEVPREKLGNIAQVSVGTKPTNIYENQIDFEYINAGTTNSGYTDCPNCEGDTVTTPSRGQGGIGYVGYQAEPFWLGPLCYKIRAKNNDAFLNKFLFYYLQSKNSELLKMKKAGGVPAINRIDLIQMSIPKVKFEQQKFVVQILDRFYTLCDDLTSGLPAEIETRQKQYEYYRDKLLSFKELGV